MAVVPKKTYSRQNNESCISERKKEKVDPFDELLSSPLKQDLQFKPLSFWNRKVKELEPKKKLKNFKWELYETSNSDDNSPNRKKNPRLKYSKQRGKTSIEKLNNNTNNVFSAVRSFIKTSRSTNAFRKVENTRVVSCEEFRKQKSQSSDNTLNFSNILSPKINSLQESYDGYKCLSLGEQVNKENCADEPGIGYNCTTYTLKTKKNVKKVRSSSLIELEKKAVLSDIKLKFHEDITAAEENLEALYDKTFINNESEELENLRMYNNKTMEETLMPLYKSSDDDFRFINVKRHFRNFSNSEDMIHGSISLNETHESPDQSENTLKEIKTPESLTFLVCEDVNIPEEDLRAYEGEDETSDFDDEEDLIHRRFYGCKIEGKTFSYVKHAHAINEERKTLSLLEFQTENADLEKSIFFSDINNNSGDLTQELLLDQIENSPGGAESSSASEENPFYLTEQESVISADVSHSKNSILTTDLKAEKELRHIGSSLKEKVTHLTMGISNLAISSATGSGQVTAGPKDEEVQTHESDTHFRDKKNNSVCIDLRNVTTKRRYRFNGRYQRGVTDTNESLLHVNALEETQAGNNPERDWEINDSLDHSGMADRVNFDWSKTLCLPNPIFESTRVQDISSDAGKFEKTMNQSQKMASLLGDRQFWLDHSYALKPGKKWMRSVSILKQIRNGSIKGDHFESTRIKGRKFESFVRDMLEMQTVLGKSGWSTSATNKSTDSSLREPSCGSVSNDLESDNLPQDINFKVSDYSLDGTVLETSLINPTIKVLHAEEKPSMFGLKISNLALEGEYSDTGKSLGMSARDFILLQCGQDEVLPFEEYFNERTLKDCKKIGEGVYGEVFRSADNVIKIIPIEGSEKVNGEPQKTFEEILSEVVIALKLSNLRNGDNNRTDGFSEVKRCWCVKGRYPKYLLHLWNEYDQSGSGSENDSPVMFKDDQLYIILELANGGKDLESFLFSSAAQSLSIFVQTTLSLAAAEKNFEFEHRDLHWGNVLISETKDKFVTIILEGVEYKIPSKGVKVCIIDFTLSRIYHEGFCIFNDLSVDPTLFTSEGDYQFEIYRMMLREVSNDWSLFKPKTNIFWLHYTLDKMINMVRYKNKKTKLHKKGQRDLKILESEVLCYKDTTDFALSDSLRDIIKRM